MTHDMAEKVCRICGEIFKPSSGTQVVCDNPECIKKNRNQVRSEWRKERRRLAKLKKLEEKEKEEIEKVEIKSTFLKRKDLDETLKICKLRGITYAEYQIERTLKLVEKINVEV